MDNNRLLYIDVIKIISIFLVIVNHTNSTIFLSLSPSPEWFISITYFYFCKVAVPMFIMATGALLLERNENYLKHAKRLWRIFIVLVIFSIFYYVLNNGLHNTLKEIKTAIRTIIQKPSTNALWYMYIYIGIIIVLPFLQKMASILNEKDVIVLIFISLIAVGIGLILGHVINVHIYDGFNLTLFCYPIGYLFSGYYINKYLSRNRIYFYTSLFIFFVSIFISVALSYHYYHKGYANILFWSDISLLNISVPSVSIFYIIKYISHSVLIQKYNKFISNISMCVFGIYLVSDFVLVRSLIFYIYVSKYINQFFACMLWQVLIFLVCFIIIFLVRKINIIKRYI